MKRPKFTVVIFYKDGKHETFEQDCGLAIDPKDIDARFIYIATGKQDAEFAIQHYTKKFEEFDKELEG